MPEEKEERNYEIQKDNFYDEVVPGSLIMRIGHYYGNYNVSIYMGIAHNHGGNGENKLINFGGMYNIKSIFVNTVANLYPSITKYDDKAKKAIRQLINLYDTSEKKEVAGKIYNQLSGTSYRQIPSYEGVHLLDSNFIKVKSVYEIERDSISGILKRLYNEDLNTEQARKEIQTILWNIDAHFKLYGFLGIHTIKPADYTTRITSEMHRILKQVASKALTADQAMKFLTKRG